MSYLCFKAVTNASSADPFCPFSDSVIRDHRGSLRRLGVSAARIGFNEVGAPGEELCEEVRALDL